jgi:hypothetical protein
MGFHALVTLGWCQCFVFLLCPAMVERIERGGLPLLPDLEAEGALLPRRGCVSPRGGLLPGSHQLVLFRPAMMVRGRGRWWCGAESLAPFLSSCGSSTSAPGTAPVMLLLTWLAMEAGRWESVNRWLPEQLEASGILWRFVSRRHSLCDGHVMPPQSKAKRLAVPCSKTR